MLHPSLLSENNIQSLKTLSTKSDDESHYPSSRTFSNEFSINKQHGLRRCLFPVYSVKVLLSLDNVLLRSLRSCPSETPLSDSICTSRHVATAGWIDKLLVSFIFLFYFCLFFTLFVKLALVTKCHVVRWCAIREIHVATSPLVSDDGGSLRGVRIDVTVKRCIDNMIFFDTPNSIFSSLWWKSNNGV